MKRAFSIIEILASIAVIAALTGIILSVVFSSRDKSYQTDDLAKLKQLSVAGSLYFEDHQAWPRSALLLARLKLVPKEIIASHADHVEDGVATLIYRSEAATAPFRLDPVPLKGFKDSFPGYAAWPILRAQEPKLIGSDGSPGWLIRINPPYEADRQVWLAHPFRYTRLTFEGAAIQRQNQPYADTKNPQFGKVWTPVTIYTDPTPGFDP